MFNIIKRNSQREVYFNVYRKSFVTGRFIVQERTQLVGVISAVNLREANVRAKQMYGNGAYADGFMKDSGESN